MPTMEHGRVLTVRVRTYGDEVVGDHAAGATVLQVDDAADFSEDGGFITSPAGVREYLTIDDDAATITLAAGIPVGLTDGDRVDLYDQEKETAVIDTVADVQVDGADVNADPIEAVVLHHLTKWLPEGIRGVNGEDVAMELRNDEWFVVDVLGQDPSLDGQAVWNPHSFGDIGTDSIPNATYTQVTSWVGRETDGIDVAADYTIRYPGVYAISAQIAFASNVNGRRRARVLVNGDNLDPVLFRSIAPDPGVVDYVGFARDVRLEENDVVTLEVWQDSGAALTFGTAAGSSNFSLHRVSV